jgi:hypothetical protein
MAEKAVKIFQQAIADARRESFAEGFSAAMRMVQEFAAKAAPAADSEASFKAPKRSGHEPPTPKARVRLSDAPYHPRIPGDAADKLIEEAYRLIAPRSAGPTEIRHTIKQNNGRALPETSARRAIDRLVAQNKLHRTSSRTWSYGAGDGGEAKGGAPEAPDNVPPINARAGNGAFSTHS